MLIALKKRTGAGRSVRRTHHQMTESADSWDFHNDNVGQLCARRLQSRVGMQTSRRSWTTFDAILAKCSQAELEVHTT